MRKRKRPANELSGGEDSLLDVIANLVGVLIILVAIASACSRTILNSQVVDQQVDKKTEQLEKLKAAAAETRTRAEQNEAGYRELESGLAATERATRRLESIRMELMVARTAALRAIQQEAPAEDSSAGIVTTRLKLQQLQSQLTRLDQTLSARDAAVAEQTIEKIVHYPTPIAKTVFSDEVHFRLEGGKVEFVPVEALIEQMKTDWKTRSATLRTSGEIEDMTGQVDGFRMNYRLGTRIQNVPGVGESMSVELTHFDITPVVFDQGEPAEMAMQDGSRFATRLQRLQAGRTTVSIWVYPDSFAQYMKLRDYLRQRGFQTAAWPVDFGQKISGGPNGMRTTAH